MEANAKHAKHAKHAKEEDVDVRRLELSFRGTPRNLSLVAQPTRGSSAYLGMTGRTAFVFRSFSYPIAQDPGAPPQRPHIGASDSPLLFGPPELTANTLRLRAASGEPHLGHLALSPRLIVRTSCSNLALHDPQVYS